MKVLVLMGSPRKKGNTYEAVRKIEERMKTLGDIEFEYLFLRDVHLEPCVGCFQCLSWGEERCPLKDDRDEIEKKILSSDGVIFATPVYAFNVTALMKNFLDRFAYTLHRPRFFNQKAMIICTTGALGLKETIDRMAVAQFAGYNLVHSAGFTTPYSKISLKAKKKIDNDIAEAAEKFYKALISREPIKPKLINLIGFKAQQTAFGLTHQYGHGDADYRYFKDRGWLDKGRQYYVDARINPVKALIARLVGWYFRRNLVKDLEEGVLWSS